MKQFKTPKRSLGDLNAESAAKLISASADLALVLDGKGIIRDVACASDEFTQNECASWIGLPWVETVTAESRPKIEELLRDATTAEKPRWRQVNHPSPGGRGDLPVNYSAFKIGNTGRVVAVGRDLKAVAALQQRLVEAQQSLEREYARIRQSETRYRALFEISSEAVVIVDASTFRVVEANPAATALLASGGARVIGHEFMDYFSSDGVQAVRGLLAAARSLPRADDVHARAAENGREFKVSASHFRQDNATYFLVQLSTVVGEDIASNSLRSKSGMLRVIERLPDAIVVTDGDRRVLTANAAFLELAQLASPSQAKGEPLDRWLGLVGVDVNVLVANLKEHGSVRRFATVVRGEFGSTEDVEISAVAVRDGSGPCFGFSMRRIERAPVNVTSAGQGLPRSIEQMTQLVGRVPMKTLVRETADIIERMCIEAALELTDDNRASAAEMLGLSRQSFYSKLRRYGLQAPADETDV